MGWERLRALGARGGLRARGCERPRARVDVMRWGAAAWDVRDGERGAGDGSWMAWGGAAREVQDGEGGRGIGERAGVPAAVGDELVGRATTRRGELRVREEIWVGAWIRNVSEG